MRDKATPDQRSTILLGDYHTIQVRRLAVRERLTSNKDWVDVQPNDVAVAFVLGEDDAFAVAVVVRV